MCVCTIEPIVFHSPDDRHPNHSDEYFIKFFICVLLISRSTLPSAFCCAHFLSLSSNSELGQLMDLSIFHVQRYVHSRPSSWCTELCHAYDATTERYWEFAFMEESKMPRNPYVFTSIAPFLTSVVPCEASSFFFFRACRSNVFVVGAQIHSSSDSWKFIVIEIINCIILYVCTTTFFARSISSAILLVTFVFNYLSWLYHRTHWSHCRSLLTPIYSYCTTYLTSECSVTNSYMKMDARARNLPYLHNWRYVELLNEFDEYNFSSYYPYIGAKNRVPQIRRYANFVRRFIYTRLIGQPWGYECSRQYAAHLWRIKAFSQFYWAIAQSIVWREATFIFNMNVLLDEFIMSFSLVEFHLA